MGRTGKRDMRGRGRADVEEGTSTSRRGLSKFSCRDSCVEAMCVNVEPRGPAVARGYVARVCCSRYTWSWGRGGQ